MPNQIDADANYPLQYRTRVLGEAAAGDVAFEAFEGGQSVLRSVRREVERRIRLLHGS